MRVKSHKESLCELFFSALPNVCKYETSSFDEFRLCVFRLTEIDLADFPQWVVDTLAALYEGEILGEEEPEFGP